MKIVLGIRLRYDRKCKEIVWRCVGLCFVFYLLEYIFVDECSKESEGKMDEIVIRVVLMC